jgi:hypothetical protein
MKYLLLILATLLLANCSTPKLLVKNCKAVGTNLFECEEIPKKELGGARR